MGRGDDPHCREANHKRDKPSLHSTCWSQKPFACSLGVRSLHYWSVVLVVHVDLLLGDLFLGLVHGVQHEHLLPDVSWPNGAIAIRRRKSLA